MPCKDCQKAHDEKATHCYWIGAGDAETGLVKLSGCIRHVEMVIKRLDIYVDLSHAMRSFTENQS